MRKFIITIILLLSVLTLANATVVQAQETACQIPAGWSPYVIQRGDTLFKIAQSVGVNYQLLAESNCIENPQRIIAGQTLYVPIAVAPQPPQIPIHFILIRPNDNGRNGVLAGCGESGVTVTSDRAASGDLRTDLTGTLQDMFAASNVLYAPSQLFNSFDGMGVRIDNLQVFGEHVVMNLSASNFSLIGTCGDARIVDQLLLNIFQYPAVNSAFISINGQNLKQLVDQSGETGPADPFFRAFTEDRCPVPVYWFPYEIVRGDTLFKISQRASSNVNEMARVNCIENPRRIFAGKTIYAPNPVEPDNKLYLVRSGDNGQSGISIGCNDSAIAIASTFTKTNDTAANVQETLNELFALQQPTQPNVNSLSNTNLVVQNVTFTADTVLVNLTGTLPLAGVCDDARKEAQIMLTIFQYDNIRRAVVLLNGQNLKQIFDLSGLLDQNAVYEKSEFLAG